MGNGLGQEGAPVWVDSIFPLCYVYYGGRVGFLWFNFVGDFVSYCFPSSCVMLSANNIIYANKTIDIMKVLEMFTFFRSFLNSILRHTT